MTSLHMNNNTVNYSIFGFDIKIYTNQNMSTNKIEQAVSIVPNKEFDSSMIDNKNIHFIYNIDYSGSMSEPINYENGRYYSRLEVCINSVIKSLEFLGKLADNGINIYITIIKFNNIASVVKEFVKLENKFVFDEIVESLKEIIPHYSTNIGESIIKIKDIENQYESKCSKIYKILLSDGYSNQGLSSQQIKDSYSKFFNVCIGIGNETQYDADLLQNLSLETTERSCNSHEEIGDQIIDSVFGHMTIIAQNLKFNSVNKPRDIITIDGQEYNKKLRITSSEYCIYDTRDFEIVISGVSSKYLKIAGLPKNSSKIQNYSSNHLNYGSIDVFYVKNQDTFDIIIKFTCNIPHTSGYKMCKITAKSFRIIQNFIHVSNIISQLDMNTYNIEKRKKIVHSIYNKLISCKRQLESEKLFLDFNYINTITDKFIDIFKPLRFSTDTNNLSDINNLTPMRMLSAQSQSGSFACVGRQASMGYSMGYNHQENDNEENNNAEDNSQENNLNVNSVMSPLNLPPPIFNTNYPQHISTLYSNQQSLPLHPSIATPTASSLYPVVSNTSNIGIFNISNNNNEDISMLPQE